MELFPLFLNHLVHVRCVRPKDTARVLFRVKRFPLLYRFVAAVNDCVHRIVTWLCCEHRDVSMERNKRAEHGCITLPRRPNEGKVFPISPVEYVTGARKSGL